MPSNRIEVSVTFPVEVSFQDGVWLCQVKEIPGVMTVDRSRRKALGELQRLTEDVLQDIIDNDELRR